MKRPEFDDYADDYEALHAASIAASGEGPAYFAAYKVDDVAAWIARTPALGPVERLLDFGCGIGGSIAHFAARLPGATVVGADASPASLAVARERHPGVDFVACDGNRLPFPDASFDFAFAAGVLHHVPPPERPALLRELARVLRPGGRLAIFEHNPLNPLTRRAVDACPFDRDAQLVHSRELAALVRDAGFGDVRVAYRIFFPHALRALRPLEPALAWLPLGAQYRVFAVRR